MRWRVERAKTKGLLFLRLFLFRSFCLKRMKSGYRAEVLSKEKNDSRLDSIINFQFSILN